MGSHQAYVLRLLPCDAQFVQQALRGRGLVGAWACSQVSAVLRVKLSQGVEEAGLHLALEHCTGMHSVGMSASRDHYRLLLVLHASLVSDLIWLHSFLRLYAAATGNGSDSSSNWHS